MMRFIRNDESNDCRRASAMMACQERLYIYNYRLYDRYRRPIATLVVLNAVTALWFEIEASLEGGD
jgi:hypothetical protein